jgi:hypothetical protein
VLRRWTAAAVLAVIGLAACTHDGTPAPTGTPSPEAAASCPSSAASEQPSPDADILNSLADRLQPYAEEHFADVYAGLVVDGQQARLRVYRKPSRAFDAWVDRAFDRDCVELQDAVHSIKELRQLQDRITADSTYWEDHGIRIIRIGTKVDGSGVEVGTNEVDRARAELPGRYGSDAPIVVVLAGPDA